MFDPPRYTKTEQTLKTDEELVKGVPKYSRTAQKGWEALSIPEDQEIDFEGESRTSGGSQTSGGRVTFKQKTCEPIFKGNAPLVR